MIFYHFRQNNSGGKLISDDIVSTHVFIEAPNSRLANIVAENIGIYFNGCLDGIDCSCCGDRWSTVDDDNKIEFPFNYSEDLKFNSIEEYASYLNNSRIHYKDGYIGKF